MCGNNLLFVGMVFSLWMVYRESEWIRLSENGFQCEIDFYSVGKWFVQSGNWFPVDSLQCMGMVYSVYDWITHFSVCE